MDRNTEDRHKAKRVHLSGAKKRKKAKEIKRQLSEVLDKTSNLKVLFMCNLIIENQLKDSFPNVEIILRIYLVLMITNCSAERSFSKLKLLKNRLRTSTSQERLIYLTLMSINHDILRELSFDDIIEDFAFKKIKKSTTVMLSFQI